MIWDRCFLPYINHEIFNFALDHYFQFKTFFLCFVKRRFCSLPLDFLATVVPLKFCIYKDLTNEANSYE